MTPAARQDAGAAPVLEMRNITKSFGAVQALKNVSLTVEAGELHALMGENGAGKSTLMKILSGAYMPDPGGEILLAGRPMTPGDPKVARTNGIAIIYQELSLSPNLTVAQNMFLGREPSRFGFVDHGAMMKAARPVLEKLGVGFSAATRVGDLSLGERQLVEIARALSADARIIVMDEPTTSLTTRETEKLFEVIDGLKRERIAVIYISHRMEEVYRLADRCSVLRDGGYVGTLERSELSAARLVSMMVGRDLSSFYRKEHYTPKRGEVILSVRNLGDGVRVHDCSFDVYRGEVLGIAGLVGSGRTELARLIYGADRRMTGTIALNGREIPVASPRDALAQGIAYLTEDRKALGLFLDMSVAENINMSVIEQDAKTGGIRDFRAAARRAAKAAERLAIRTQSLSINAGSLSGGNQQKVLLARLLETAPKVVILDEPTRGVDVGAKSEIYRLIDELAKRDIAVVIISSELPEIVGVADRALVMREGRIAGEVTASAERPIDQEAVMALSTGAVSAQAAAPAA